ncbi:TetR/AcrR family transcriptional regulator [Actinacidiphila oryziradicis]|uniref:TetR/AcrR family transcriptional regulator n=1 Tax=Actinacidiphila oryziradicis TaxID=2571141 RepID=UPI0023F3DF1C|nr:TetR/AcrR family transcriptional regulator [Actinacidiphila oryziradicis]MCW2875179.1 regulatory protein TetR [Actinacidiphila oryziradicis]
MSHQSPESGRTGVRPCRTLRADAERNRSRLVEAAQAVFAESGLDAPLEDIAERAGVGIATLYRRFPSREELIAATYEAKMTEYAKAAEEALDAPDAWTGFTGCIERICAMQAENRGFTNAVTMGLPSSEEMKALKDRTKGAIDAVVHRAQEEGVLREDFVAEDITLLLLANAGVLRATRDAAPHAWRRLIAYLLESFQVQGDRSGPLPAPPTAIQMRRAMMAYKAQASRPEQVEPDDCENEDSPVPVPSTGAVI